jgi:hypothetical protein
MRSPCSLIVPSAAGVSSPDATECLEATRPDAHAGCANRFACYIGSEILSFSNSHIRRQLTTVRMEKGKSERRCANGPEGAD